LPNITTQQVPLLHSAKQMPLIPSSDRISKGFCFNVVKAQIAHHKQLSKIEKKKKMLPHLNKSSRHDCFHISSFHDFLDLFAFSS
jgi:hypothetical protein